MYPLKNPETKIFIWTKNTINFRDKNKNKFSYYEVNKFFVCCNLCKIKLKIKQPWCLNYENYRIFYKLF